MESAACDDIDCDSLVSVSAAVYARVRRNPDWFIVTPGHQGPREFEHVVEESAEYFVIQKTEFAERAEARER